MFFKNKEKKVDAKKIELGVKEPVYGYHWQLRINTVDGGYQTFSSTKANDSTDDMDIDHHPYQKIINRFNSSQHDTITVSYGNEGLDGFRIWQKSDIKTIGVDIIKLVKETDE